MQSDSFHGSVDYETCCGQNRPTNSNSRFRSRGWWLHFALRLMKSEASSRTSHHQTRQLRIRSRRQTSRSNFALCLARFGLQQQIVASKSGVHGPTRICTTSRHCFVDATRAAVDAVGATIVHSGVMMPFASKRGTTCKMSASRAPCVLHTKNETLNRPSLCSLLVVWDLGGWSFFVAG
jgi:hypothetical protein